MLIFAAYKDLAIVILGAIGFVMTIRTFRFNLQQRKIENTFKIIEFMRRHIGEKQIETFVEIFHANNPLGVPEQEFHFADGRKEHLDDFFSEGGSGNGDIHNMIEIFNLVSVSLLKGELKDELVWYEYGQIMTKCFQWTDYLESQGPDRKYYQDVLERSKGLSWLKLWKLKRQLKPYVDPKFSFSKYFNIYMRKSQKRNLRLATKYYTYLE